MRPASESQVALGVKGTDTSWAAAWFSLQGKDTASKGTKCSKLLAFCWSSVLLDRLKVGTWLQMARKHSCMQGGKAWLYLGLGAAG